MVFLLPGAFAGFLTSLASGRYIDRFGARAVLIAGAAATLALVTLGVWLVRRKST